jgi:hypothetical protein
VLNSPRPDSADPTDAANALAFMVGFQRLSPVEPTGLSKNTLVFDPPLVVAFPDNCTDSAEIVVERRELPERTEKFTITTTSVPPTETSRGLQDSDTLYLTCLAVPDPTPTVTETPLPTESATPGETPTPNETPTPTP